MHHDSSQAIPTHSTRLPAFLLAMTCSADFCSSSFDIEAQTVDIPVIQVRDSPDSSAQLEISILSGSASHNLPLTLKLLFARLHLLYTAQHSCQSSNSMFVSPNLKLSDQTLLDVPGSFSLSDYAAYSDGSTVTHILGL